MPDPLTTLGAAAAASQFVEQGLTVVQFLYSTISAMVEAPEIVRKRLQQLDQLLAISKLIIQHPSFQTDAIASVLETCLADIKKLQDMLLKLSVPTDAQRVRRWNKAFLAVMKEDGVLRAFSNLDREKTTLIVCMEVINAGLLHSIGIQVEVVQTTLGDASVVIRDSARNLQTIKDVLPEVQEQVTTIHERLPEISDRLAVLDGILPDILAALQANQTPKFSGYFNIPNRRVRQFVGREDVLSEMHQGLSSESESSLSRCVVLRSLGGQGKSQTALEYCRRYRNHTYSSIFWIDAFSEKSIKQAFSIFYERSDRSGNAQLRSNEAIIMHVCDVFERDTNPWLLVFDNLDSPETLMNIRQYMPASQNGSILITTRHSEVQALSSCIIELGPLAECDAVQLLRAVDTEQADDHDAAAAKEIVARLSYHPLAIAQASAYIRKKRLPLSAFMDRYNQSAKEILSQTIPMTEYQRNLGSSETATALNVFTTWQLSFDQLRAEDNAKKHKKDLLDLLAFFHNHEVSEVLFKTFCENIEPWDTAAAMSNSPGSYLADHLGNWDTQDYSEVLEEFYDLALIENYQLADDGFYNSLLHPLVKDWIRLRLDTVDSLKYQLLCSEIMLEFVDPSRALGQTQAGQDHMTQASIERLPEQGAILDESEAQTSLSIDEYELSNQSFAALVAQAGYHGQSNSLTQKVIQMALETSGDESKDSVTEEYGLAKSLYQQGKTKEAETLFRSLLPKAITLDGLQKDSCGYMLLHLAGCLMRMGGKNLDEAQLIFEKDLAGILSNSGLDRGEALASMNGLAQVLKERGEYQEAERVQREAVSLAIELHGEMNERTLFCLDGLGHILFAQSKYEEARSYHWRAVEGHQKVLGDLHPSTLISIVDLASCTRDNPENAVQLAKKATAGLTKIQGPEHPFTCDAMSVLGQCLRRQRNYDEAEILLRRVLEINTRIREADNSHTLDNMVDLALTLRDKGYLEEAEMYVNKAMAGQIRSHGFQHPSVLVCVSAQRSIIEAKEFVLGMFN